MRDDTVIRVGRVVVYEILMKTAKPAAAARSYTTSPRKAQSESGRKRHSSPSLKVLRGR